MRVLVCGSRYWSRRGYLFAKLDSINHKTPITCVIEGEARGADRLGAAWAEFREVPIERYPANWEEYGRAAGPIRNEQMLVSGKPDLVVAFHEDISTSRGTGDMVRRAKAAGVPTLLFDGKRA